MSYVKVLRNEIINLGYEVPSIEKVIAQLESEFGIEILGSRIIATTFAYIALLFTSLLGSIMPTKNGPKDAIKIFSSIEMAMYGGPCGDGPFENGHFCWAPCYQPEPTSHGLGGDINKENAF